MLADAGILIHCFDGWENHERVWLFPEGVDTSTSLVYSENHVPERKIPIFHDHGGGFILRPHATKLKCGKGGDSAGKCDEHRRCPSVDFIGDVSQYHQPGDGCGGSWDPSDFGIFLQRQTAWQLLNKRLDHNEIIVDAAHLAHHLPDGIEAFVLINSNDQMTVRMHGRFLEEFGLNDWEVPLVRMNDSEWLNPFQPYEE